MSEGIPGARFGAQYAPNGFVDSQDQRALDLALVNPWLSDQVELYATLAAGLDQGDEVFEPNVFAYIPTEQQVAAAIAVANMQANNATGLSPQSQQTSPRLAQLTQSLYRQAAALWSELSVADTEGW